MGAWSRPIVVRPWWLAWAAFDFFMAGLFGPWPVRVVFGALGIGMFWPTSTARQQHEVALLRRLIAAIPGGQSDDREGGS